MNKDNAAQFLPLVQALAEGKTIQYQMADGRWEDRKSPEFTSDPQCYRIKPEPKKPLEFDLWIAFNDEGRLCHYTNADMSKIKDSEWRKIKVREVVEEVEQ